MNQQIIQQGTNNQKENIRCHICGMYFKKDKYEEHYLKCKQKFETDNFWKTLRNR